MTVRVLQGKLYMGLKKDTGAGFKNDTAYSSGWSIGTAALALEANAIASVKILPHDQSSTIEEKSVVDFVNGNLNKKSALTEVTGKIMIEIDLSTYNAAKTMLDRKVCELRVIDADNLQLLQVVGFVPNFAETTKFGEIQKAEITFTYRQAANIGNSAKKYRVVSITA